MTTERKNFSGEVTPRILDTEYISCNFMQPQPDMSGPPVGVRIFPGDDTPRHFQDSNLVNCLVPPGSTFNNCNTAIIEYDVLMSTDDIVIDGAVVSTEPHYSNFVHGRYLQSDGSLERKPSPEEIVIS